MMIHLKLLPFCAVRKPSCKITSAEACELAEPAKAWGCYDMLRPTSHTVTQLNQINQWSRILWVSPQTGPLRLLQARLATAAWCRVCGRCRGERWADSSSAETGSKPNATLANLNIYYRCSCSLKYGTYINNMYIYINIYYTHILIYIIHILWDKYGRPNIFNMVEV